MSQSSISPILRYRDPEASAKWLCKAFGFSLVPKSDEKRDTLSYFSVSLGDQNILVFPAIGSLFDQLMAQPGPNGQLSTQSCYINVKDADEHCAQAVKSGAKIEMQPQDDHRGGKFYMCRDLEGHLWTFGTHTYGAIAPAHNLQKLSNQAGFALSFAVLSIAGFAVGGWWLLSANANNPSLSEKTATFISQQTAQISAAKQSLKSTSEELSKARQQKREADLALQSATVLFQEQLKEKGLALSRAEHQSKEAAKELKSERELALVQKRSLDELTVDLAKSRAEYAILKQTALRKNRERENLGEAKMAVERKAELVTKQLAAHQAIQDDLSEKLKKARQELSLVNREGQDADTARQTLKDNYDVQLSEKNKELAELNMRNAELTQSIELMNKQLTQLREANQKAQQPQKVAIKQVPKPKPKKVQAEKNTQTNAPSKPQSGTPCARAVQTRILGKVKRTKPWKTALIQRLCAGAQSSTQPATCYTQLMGGNGRWGGIKKWNTSNALNLCGGTQNARHTLNCFRNKVAAKQSWQSAVEDCMAN